MFTRRSPGSRRRKPIDWEPWVLVPIRLFLGVTFVYAGLQKLADRWFFSSSAPSSVASQLHATSHTSPIGGLVSPLAGHALVVGLLIAFAELAVGALTLVGLWARPAAGVGAALSLGFLLTVSWHTRPYYYGADVVFLFAWTPLLLAGAGPYSLDARAKAEARVSLGLARSNPVSIEFGAVQRLCGAYEGGRCRARNGSRCRIEGCPVLADVKAQRAAAELDRRAFLQKAGWAGWLGTATLLGSGLVAVLGRLLPPAASTASKTIHLTAPTTGGPGATTTDPTTTTTAPVPDTTRAATATTRPATATTGAPTPTTSAVALPVGKVIGPASGVPVGQAAQFTDPSTGDPAYVLHPATGKFVAFDAVCTHAGCTVEYAGSIFQCPCHGAQFDSSNGQVVRGPARRPLPQIPVQEGADGNLYVT